MRQNILPPVPHVGMRVIKTAVAVMISYAIFAPFGLIYRHELGGVLGQMGPLYACIACIVCIQSSLGQTVRQGVSRFIGVLVGGALGAATLLLGEALNNPAVLTLALGVLTVAGLWICLLLRRPAACAMACIVPCVILITGVTGVERYYYAAARLLETVVGVAVAFVVNALLPTHHVPEGPQAGKGAELMKLEVKNTTKKLCVIGDPVLHSKSPLIQNTMIQALGLDYLYLCQQVPRGEAERWLSCAAFAGYAGFNATMPHKEALVPLMDVLDEDARRCGAVNTVCIRGGKYYGYNTDGAGFVRALSGIGISPAGKRIVLLGAGGAAKAVALRLAREGAAEVVVCNRTPDKAAALCALAPGEPLRPAGFDPDTLAREAAGCDLLVNCTSLGMTGTGGQFETFSFLDALRPEAAVCDLIYSPAETQLLAQARQRGHRTMNGLGMLIHQAILALEHFTGQAIDPADVLPLVRAALEAELEETG